MSACVSMLHDLLSAKRDEIIVRWQRKLRERHPDRPVDELLHTIPLFIDEVITAEANLRHGEERPADDSGQLARAHGEQRFRNGYPIGDIAMDFSTVSDVIGELAIEEQFDLDPQSYKLLNKCIDTAIANSISEYFNLSRESEQQDVAAWIGSLGHELRNAVASAQMAFDVISSGQVGLQSRTARVLQRSLHRIEALVTQTLAAVQLRSRQELKRENIHLQQLVEDIAAGALPERDISVNLHIDPALHVCVDARLLESALSNLLQNAIKFTISKGRVDVRAWATPTDTVIEVEDECGGLAGQNIDELFTPFVQRGQVSRGVGLGLAITREAIEAHGGTVTVRDDAPRGCVFSVWLPHQ